MSDDKIMIDPQHHAPRSWWPLLLAAPVAATVSWMAYSALGIDHRREMPPALPGRTRTIGTTAGDLNLYSDGPRNGTPLLLVHSVNAAANAYEVRPLYLHYRASRPVYAIDLPGFGFSQRADRIYTPRVMADALHAAIATIRAENAGQAVDVIALSVSCEYLARASLEQPDAYRSIGLISPTGFDKLLSGDGAAQSTRGSPITRALVTIPFWSQALFDALVSRPSMRLFLEKTWGSKNIDEGLFEYDQLSAHQPGARHAVWSFLSGYLFANDVSRLYRLLTLPVWAVHGTRGDFVDYSHESEMTQKPNWSFDTFDTGAFPHFEQLARVTRSYDGFQLALNGGT